MALSVCVQQTVSVCAAAVLLYTDGAVGDRRCCCDADEARLAGGAIPSAVEKLPSGKIKVSWKPTEGERQGQQM